MAVASLDLKVPIAASVGETLDNNDLNQAVASSGLSENKGLVKV